MATTDKQLAAQGQKLSKARVALDSEQASARSLAESAYKDGTPITHIGATLGVSTKTLYKWLTESGLYTRPAA